MKDIWNNLLFFISLITFVISFYFSYRWVECPSPSQCLCLKKGITDWFSDTMWNIWPKMTLKIFGSHQPLFITIVDSEKKIRFYHWVILNGFVTSHQHHYDFQARDIFGNQSSMDHGHRPRSSLELCFVRVHTDNFSFCCQVFMQLIMSLKNISYETVNTKCLKTVRISLIQVRN